MINFFFKETIFLIIK